LEPLSGCESLFRRWGSWFLNYRRGGAEVRIKTWQNRRGKQLEAQQPS